ncbi:MAG: serine/threonine-protein kinase [Myxococcota bacterium]
MANSRSSGTLLGGRYRLGESLGKGAMGTLMKAVDERLQRSVAIKFIRTDRSVPKAVERFEREAMAVAKFGDPNIVGVLDFAHDDEGPYLVMEYLEGETLGDRLRRGPLEPEDAVAIGVQVLAGLAEAHRGGVVHRDIKPDNIFLLAGDRLRVKLLDFGLAYLLEEQSSSKLTATGITVGTPAYMAPERLLGDRVDPRSDLYSVGVCLYKALSGALPHSGPDAERKALLVDPRTLRQHGKPIDPALEAIVRKSMEKYAGARYASADAMADALKAWRPTVAAREETPKRRDGATKNLRAPARKPRRRALWVAAAVGAQVLVFGGMLYRNAASSGEAIAPASAPPPEPESAATEGTPPEVSAPECAAHGTATEGPASERAATTVSVPASPASAERAARLPRAMPADAPMEATPTRPQRAATMTTMRRVRSRRGERPSTPAAAPSSIAARAAALPDQPVEPDWSQAMAR